MHVFHNFWILMGKKIVFVIFFASADPHSLQFFLHCQIVKAETMGDILGYFKGRESHSSIPKEVIFGQLRPFLRP